MQVALFIEEHEPSLQAAILSAVDAGATTGGRGARRRAARHPRSHDRAGRREVPRVVDRAVRGSASPCARTRHGARHAGRRRGVAACRWVPSSSDRARRRCWCSRAMPRRRAPTPSRLSRATSPCPRAPINPSRRSSPGFRSNDVSMMVKAAGAAAFERMPLVAGGEADRFRRHALRRQAPVEYYVEADGVRSPTYAMKVVELPAVENLELEYVFPAYTGLAPQKVESGGDVAALRGTQVRVRVKPTMASPRWPVATRARVRRRVWRPRPDGTLTGSFTIGEDGFYHVELDGPSGEKVTASPKFTIDAIEDQAPTVSFEKPKRDIKANAVEEVFLQARADDDYGVRSLELVYSVNGGAEKTVSLLQPWRQGAQGSERRPHRVSRGAGRQAGRLRVVLREGDRHGHGEGAEERRRATSTSSRCGRSARTSGARSRRPAVAVAAAAVVAAASRTRLARCPSSSGRSCPRRSTSSATARR